MIFPGKKASVVTIIHNDELHFIQQKAPFQPSLLFSIPVDLFLELPVDDHSIPDDLTRCRNTLLVVPDYWVGTTSFVFQSRKTSLAETFIERKLKSEYPENKDILNFIEYSFYQEESGEKRLRVQYFQDSKPTKIYEKLEAQKMRPQRITTPAYLWNHKVSWALDNFEDGGTCLVHKISGDCYLYFFHQGLFVFSRSITLPDDSQKTDDILNALTFEINQSLYLFSQRTKEDLNTIFLLSSASGDGKALADSLQRSVIDISEQFQEEMPSEIIRKISVISRFRWSDMQQGLPYLSLTHSDIKIEEEWKPIQRVGIAIGLILVLLLGIEAAFLNRFSMSGGVRMLPNERNIQMTIRENLERYNNALDQLLVDARRPSLPQTLIRIVRCLPGNIAIREMAIELENDPRLQFKGIVEAGDPSDFRNTLALLIDNLKQHFEGGRDLRIQSVDFELAEENAGSRFQKYLIKLEFAIP